MSETIVFIDTEFTDFTNMDLISIGAVTEDGQHEFYVEVTDHCADYRSGFVNDVVMPLLDAGKYGKTRAWAGLNYREWLENLPGDTVTIVVDYVGDYMLSAKLLDYAQLSKPIEYKVIGPALTSTLHERGFHSPSQVSRAHKALYAETSNYFNIDKRQHHALVDAKANRYGWIRAFEAAK